jgi:Cu+-exporting ATPase
MAKVKDPVCGMVVDTEKTPFRCEAGGQTVYFCAESCRRAWESRRPLRAPSDPR